MRYLLIVAVVTALTVGGLAVWKQAPEPKPTPSLVALAAPGAIVQGESVTMFGGFTLPAGSYEIGTYACQADSCRRSLWRRVGGPGEWWGSLGSVRFDEVAADATIELRIFEADTVTDRVLGVLRRDVDVLSVPDVGDHWQDWSEARAILEDGR